MPSTWGGLSDIIEEARKRHEEEERKKAIAKAADEARTALARERNQPVPEPRRQENPWKPPVIPPVQRDIPGPYDNPNPGLTNTPEISSSNPYQRTVQVEEDNDRPSRLNLSPVQIGPQPMSPAISDRLRPGYEEPNRPMVPTEPRFAGQQQPQEGASSPWRPMLSWFNKPQEPDLTKPYQLRPDEKYPVTRQQVFDTQPEPIQNRVWNSITQEWNDLTGSFNQPPQQPQQAAQQPPSPGNGFAPPDVLRGEYNAPNRPMIPVPPRPAFGPQDNSSLIIPDGSAFWELYKDTPEYRLSYEHAKDRNNYDVPTYEQALNEQMDWQKVTLDDGTVLNTTPSLSDYTYAGLTTALNSFAPTREIIEQGSNILDYSSVPWLAGINAPILPGGTSISSILTPIGAQLNEALNPFSPNYDPMKLLTGFSVANEGFIKGAVGDQAQYQEARKLVADAIAETGDPSLKIALRPIGGSDPVERVQAVLDFMQKKPQMVAQLQQEAQEAQGHDPVRAGQLFAKAQELQNMTLAEAVDQNLDPWAELFYGLVDPVQDVALSPLFEILGLVKEGRVIRRAAKQVDVGAGTVIERLSQASKKGEKLADALAEGNKEGRKVYQGIVAASQNRVEKITTSQWLGWMQTNASASAKASKDSNILGETLVGVFNGISEKSDYRKIMPIVITNPEQLVKGVVGLSEDAMTRLAQPDGMVRWGAGAVGNADTVRRVPLLKTAENELLGMRSIQGTGKVNPVEFQAEVKEILYDAARRVNGGKAPKKLPFGAAEVGVERLSADSAQVVYKDAKGNVVRRARETTIPAAQRQYNEIQRTLKPGVNLAGVPGDVLRAVANAQRFIMNDVWLFTRPANWINNAVSASIGLFAHDAFTFTPLSDIHEWNAIIHGGFQPTNRLAQTIPGASDLVKTMKDEAGGSAIGTVAKWATGTADNKVTQTMNAVQNIPYGPTEIRVGNWAIPVGEEALAARANYVPAKRAFDTEIVGNTNRNLVPKLQAIEGLPPEMVKATQNQVVNLAQKKGKMGIAPGIREFVGKPVVKQTLHEIGIPQELLSLSGARDIERLLSDASPSDIDAVDEAITEIFHRERMRPASVLSLDSGGPGFKEWTEADMATEAGWVADTLAEDAIRAGVNPEQARQEATELAAEYLKEQNATWDRVLQDMEPVATNPAAWDVTVDFYLDTMRARNTARAAVDEAGRAARELGTPEAWAQKWETTRRVYGGLRQELPQIAERARLGLQDVLAGKAYVPRNDWFATVESYMRWDEEAFHGARAINLGGVEDDAALWERKIAANREYLDNSYYELFHAWQMNPGMDNFDIVRQGMRRIETMGAQTAHELYLLRQQRAAGQISADQYNRIRNAKWDKFFDDAVELNAILEKVIIRNGLAEQVPSQLKWVEGDITYQLLGPSEVPGKWKARNTKTNAVEEFSVATHPEENGPFTVPKNVVDDYSRLVGDDAELDKAADAIVQQIGERVSKTPRPSRNAYNPERFQRDPSYQQWWEERPSTAKAERDAYYDAEIGGWVERQRTRPAEPAAAVEPTPAPTPTAPTNDDIRKAASEAGIATATDKGRPTDKHLLNSLNKRMGTSVSSLDDLTDAQRVSAIEAMGARGEEQVSRMSPAEAKRAVETPTPASTFDLPEGYTLKQGERFDSIKGKWAVFDEEGNLVGNYRKTQDEAVREFNELRTRGAQMNADREAYNNAIAQLKTGNITEDALKTISKGRTYITRQTALDTLTSMGLSNKEAKGVIARASLYGETSGGAMLYNPEDIVRRGLRKLEPSGTDALKAPAFGESARSSAARTESMFAETGEDLPLISGAAPRAEGTGEFRPQQAAGQESMFDLRPQMGSKQPSYKPKTPRPTSMGDVAKSEAQGALETQRALAKEWDRVASAELGLPSIDSLILRFKRNGAINLNLDKGEIKLFEDLYGNTIAGMPINNLGDVERYLQTYNDLGKQIAGSKTTVAKSKQFAKMSAQEIVKETRDEFLAAGYSEAEIKEIAKDRRGLLDTLATIRGENPDEFGLVGYDFAVPNVSHILGLEDKADGYNVWRRTLDSDRRVGTNGAIGTADVARATILNLNDAERTIKSKLPELLAGTPNTMTGAQKLAVVDAVTDWLPEYDNVAAISRMVGKEMADHIMLNVEDQRDFDSLLSILMPYSYFWSRMPSRILSAALAKPSLVNFFHQVTRAIDMENDREGVPDRLRGSLPIPGTDKRIQLNGIIYNAAMGGALNYLQPNPYMEADPTDNAAEKIAKQVNKYTPGFFPTINFLLDVADGKVDKTYSSLLNNMIVIPSVGAPVSSVVQAATGNMPSQQGIMARIGFGSDTTSDGFALDAYYARRAVGWIAQEEGLDENAAKYADQVIMNQYNGDPIGKDIPPEELEAAIALAQRGVKRAAQDKIVGRSTSYLTGTSIVPYTDAEKQQTAANNAYWASGYDPITNPYGSKEAQKAQLEADPSALRGWAKSSETPGIDAQISQLYDEGYATGDWDTVMPKIDALKAQKAEITGEPIQEPNVTPPTPGSVGDILRGSYGDATNGMNPQEQLDAQQEAIASKYWDEYHALPKEGDERAEYLRTHPDFVAIYDANEVKNGREPNHWWEKESKGSKGEAKAPDAENGGNALEPGSVARSDFTEEELDQYYGEYLGFNDTKDWDGQKEWLLDHPEFARMEADRKFDKDGEYPWWYEDIFGEGGVQGAAGLKRPPSQPNSTADVLRRPYDAPGTGDNPGALGQGRKGAAALGEDYSTNWDEYRALGEDWDAKKKYMQEHPEFAKYYKGRYGKDAAWWEEGNTGGKGSDAWDTNWDEYNALGDDFTAKKQYMLDHPEFAAYYKARYDNAWWEETYGGSGYFRRSYGGGYRSYGGGGGGGGGGGYSNPIRIDPRQMDRSLWEGPRFPQRPWVPYSNVNPDWLMAGRDLQPEPIRKWQPPRWS